MAKKNYIRPLDLKNGRIDMGHGAGGRAAAQLIEELFVAALDNPYLRQGDDSASFAIPVGGRMVMATDGHVVSPLFFPGGDIGCLSVHGTLNDVAMSGAQPLYLAASFIIEEGFPLAELKRIVDSMAAAAREAGVPVVTGDTKVVERGKGDGVFISTTGVGVVAPGVDIAGVNARPGDVVLLSGTIGDHGVAILSKRESLEFETTIESDTAALHTLVAAMLQAAPGGVRVEATIPVLPQVDAACELLGLDPLYIANEGKLIAICSPESADALLLAMRAHPLGAHAARIGTVTEDAHHFVQMNTRFGGRRVVDWLSGEQLPRIC